MPQTNQDTATSFHAALDGAGEHALKQQPTSAVPPIVVVVREGLCSGTLPCMHSWPCGCGQSRCGVLSLGSRSSLWLERHPAIPTAPWQPGLPLLALVPGSRPASAGASSRLSAHPELCGVPARLLPGSAGAHAARSGLRQAKTYARTCCESVQYLGCQHARASRVLLGISPVREIQDACVALTHHTCRRTAS